MLCVAFVGDDVISPTLTTYNNADDVNCPTLAGSTKPTGEWITCKSGKPGTHPHMVDSGNMNENFGEGWLTVCHQKVIKSSGVTEKKRYTKKFVP